MIKTVVQYQTAGKTFPTLQKALDHRTELIEQFMRNAPGFMDVRYKQRMEFIEYVVNNRDALRALLDYSDKPDDDGLPWD